MRVLVIGGNGFLGSSLVERLSATGHRVRVLDRGHPRPDVAWNGIEYMRGTLADAPAVREALAGVDLVYHLASTTVPGTSNLDPVGDVEGNLVGTLRLLHAMQEAGLRRIVYYSSGGTVYGNPEIVPVPEQHPLSPISSYGVVKASIEAYLGMYARLGMLDPLVLRPSNPYGPRQSSSGLQGVIAAFMRSAREGRPVTIWGDGGTVRDYLHVDDLVGLAVEAGVAGARGTYNVGSGEGYSLLAIRDLIQDVAGVHLDVRHEPARAFDVRRIVLDISLARRELGWFPRISLAEGIAHLWKHPG